MATLSREECSLVLTVLRRVDKKVTFEVEEVSERHARLRLRKARNAIEVSVPLEALRAVSSDARQAEVVRRTLKRAVDRMQFVPPPIALDVKKVRSSVEAPFRGSRGRR